MSIRFTSVALFLAFSFSYEFPSSISMTSSSSFSSLSQCPGAFSNQRINTSLFTKADIDAQIMAPSDSTKSVFVIGESADSDGKLLILERRGESWRSKFSPTNVTTEGTPYYLPIALGSRLARVLGFHYLSPTKIMVPTAARLNKAIRRLNKMLIKRNLDPIQLTYYDTGKEEEVPLQELLSRFVNEAGFPLSSIGTLVVHDISYHTLSFLIPTKALNHARVQSALILKFVDFLQEKMPTQTDDFNKALKKTIYDIIYRRVYFTDIGTGNLAPILLRFRRGSEHEDALDLLGRALSHLTGDGESAKIHLQDMLPLAFNQQGWVSPELMSHKLQIEKLLNEFLEKINDPIYDLELLNERGSKYTSDDYLKDIENRIEALKALTKEKQ